MDSESQILNYMACEVLIELISLRHGTCPNELMNNREMRKTRLRTRSIYCSWRKMQLVASVEVRTCTTDPAVKNEGEILLTLPLILAAVYRSNLYRKDSQLLCNVRTYSTTFTFKKITISLKNYNISFLIK